MDSQESSRLAQTTKKAYSKLQSLHEERDLEAFVSNGLDSTEFKGFCEVQLSIAEIALRDSGDDFAKAANMELSTRVLALPREIRDMIYVYLWNCNPQPFYEMVWPGDGHPWERSCSGPPCDCLKMLPHFVDCNVMGRRFAREVLETFQSVAANYIMHLTVSSKNLDAFVNADGYHVGITPEKLFRALDLEITLGSFVYGDSRTYAAVEPSVVSQIKEITRLLLSIPYAHERAITFNITHSHEQTVNLRDVCRLLRPAFHGLKEKGLDVKLYYLCHDIDVDWKFGVEAWQWGADEWKDYGQWLGELNIGFGFGPIGMGLPDYLCEEEVAMQKTTLKVIVEELYGLQEEVF